MSHPYVRATGVLLCMVVASLVVACGKDDVAPVDVEKQAFEDLRTDIRDAIADPVREAEALRLVGVLEEDLAALRNTVTARRSRVNELNANYDTPRADFEAFFARVEDDVRDNKIRLYETHRAFLSSVTADERSAIAKAHTKAMNTAIKTIQSI